MRHDEPSLRVRDLHAYLETNSVVGNAVDGIDFGVDDGETVRNVGESGFGRSITGESSTRFCESLLGVVLERTDNSVRGDDDA